MSMNQDVIREGDGNVEHYVAAVFKTTTDFIFTANMSPLSIAVMSLSAHVDKQSLPPPSLKFWIQLLCLRQPLQSRGNII